MLNSSCGKNEGAHGGGSGGGAIACLIPCIFLFLIRPFLLPSSCVLACVFNIFVVVRDLTAVGIAWPNHLAVFEMIKAEKNNRKGKTLGKKEGNRKARQTFQKISNKAQ